MLFVVITIELYNNILLLSVVVQFAQLKFADIFLMVLLSYYIIQTASETYQSYVIILRTWEIIFNWTVCDNNNINNDYCCLPYYLLPFICQRLNLNVKSKFQFLKEKKIIGRYIIDPLHKGC